MGEVVLLRHGQTQWSTTGRHTGRTDIPLTETGRARARSLAPLLARRSFRAVWSSPLQRAVDTAAGAGLSITKIDARLQEWDYGGYEGLTTEEIRAQGDPRWTVFTDGVPAGRTPGETLGDVAERAAAVQRDLATELKEGDVAVIAHGHYLRVFAAVWLGALPAFGARLSLGAGSLSVLGHEHQVPTIALWNQTSQRGPAAPPDAGN